MLSLGKKQDKSVMKSPNWRPNFRDFERLPDTKVVRTAFFINALAVTVALALLIVTGYREYAVSNLRDQAAALEEEIASKQAHNSRALALNQQFLDLEKKIVETAAFATTPLYGLEFIHAISRTLPEEMTLFSIAYAERGAALRGGIQGSPDFASGIANNYLDTLKESEFGPQFASVTLGSLTRDPVSGRLTFEINLNHEGAR